MHAEAGRLLEQLKRLKMNQEMQQQRVQRVASMENLPHQNQRMKQMMHGHCEEEMNRKEKERQDARRTVKRLQVGVQTGCHLVELELLLYLAVESYGSFGHQCARLRVW